MADPHRAEIADEGRAAAARIFASHAICLDEFEKMLRAMKAFVTEIYDKLTVEERGELHRVLQEERLAYIRTGRA